MRFGMHVAPHKMLWRGMRFSRARAVAARAEFGERRRAGSGAAVCGQVKESYLRKAIYGESIHLKH